MEIVSIEGVCTANFDRSTMFRDVARHIAKEKSWDKYVDISASGSKAKKIATLTSPEQIQDRIINVGENLGVYSDINKDDEEKRILYAMALQIIRGQGGIFRGYALGEKGIRIDPAMFQQTVAVNDRNIILGMDEKRVADINLIYENSGNNPLIETFPDFVGIKDKVPDPLGKNLDAYRELRDYFLEFTPLALEKTLDLYGK
jgi:protein-tyrosine-phosphatase